MSLGMLPTSFELLQCESSLFLHLPPPPSFLSPEHADTPFQGNNSTTIILQPWPSIPCRNTEWRRAAPIPTCCHTSPDVPGMVHVYYMSFRPTACYFSSAPAASLVRGLGD